MSTDSKIANLDTAERKLRKFYRFAVKGYVATESLYREVEVCGSCMIYRLVGRFACSRKPR